MKTTTMPTFQELTSFQQGTLAWILPKQYHLLERHYETDSGRVSSQCGVR